MKIKNYFSKIIILRILFLIFRFIITLVNAIIGFFVLNMLLDKIFPLPIMVFHIYWFIILGVICTFFINLLIRILELKIKPYEYLQNSISKHIKLENKDDVINAFFLEKELVLHKRINFSYELANEFIKNLEKRIIEIKPHKIVEFDRIFKVLPLNLILIFLVFILYMLPPYVIKESIHKILFTRKPEILGIFVSPKDIKIPFKESCEIKVIVDKNYEFYTPSLFMKIKGSDGFVKVNFDYIESFLNRKVYKYKINSVEEKIFYKIKFRGVNTKTFIIEPIVYPEISEIKIFVYPPKYTGIQPYQIHTFNETKYFYDTEIKFVGKTNKEISNIFLLFSDGEKLKLKLEENYRFSGSFKVKKNTDLWFNMIDKEKISDSKSLKYKINVIEDKPPKIELISPQDEIIVSPNVKIPLIFSCEDDISLTKIELEYYVNNNTNNKKIKKVKEYNISTKEALEEYFFDLSKLEINLGDVISYCIIVYDNNPFKKQYNVTPTRKIEIFSYERQHQNIQKQIEEFNKKSLDLLSKEIELNEMLSNNKQLSETELEKLISLHNKTIEDFKKLQEIVSSIVKNMSTDPYTSFDTYMEFKNMEFLVEDINSSILPKLIDKLKNNNLSEAEKLQEQLIDSLERITILPQEIIKKQNMQNIAEVSKNISNSSKDILDILKNYSSSNNLPEEDRIKLNNLLKEIEDGLKKISNLIKNLPHNLPEEFVNQKDIKNIDFVSSVDLISQIKTALDNKNTSLALSLAQSLLDYLNNITQKLLGTSSNVSLNYNFQLNDELQNLINSLSNIISSENEIYEATKKIESYRISEVLKKQEESKSVIVDKINDVINKINNISSINELTQFQQKFLYKQNSEKIINNLKMILSEIKENKFLKTPQATRDSKKMCDENLELIKNLNIEEYKNLIETTKELKEKIDKLDEIINSEPEIKYPQHIIQQNTELINKQNLVINNTEKFFNQLKSFGKKSFLISYEDILIVNQSIEEMNNSKIFLENKSFSSALQKQSLAINLLLELKNKFDDKKLTMQQMSNSLGKPMNSELQYKSFFNSKLGVLTGRVMLPSVKDYEPPKELREDIIKSLSEKYPEDLEKIIQKYYRELLR